MPICTQATNRSQTTGDKVQPGHCARIVRLFVLTGPCHHHGRSFFLFLVLQLAVFLSFLVVHQALLLPVERSNQLIWPKMH